jgi:ethanolamine utilization protein EutQ (cupin superfamily)
MGCPVPNTLISKISKSIPLTIPVKSHMGTVNSTRLKSKVESKNTSNQTSRKPSFQDSRKESIIGIKLVSKDQAKKDQSHNRSNSTISKKSTSRDIKNSFKIDISKLVAKQ